MKKQKICPNCGDIITPGHRKDKCQKKFGKLQRASNNKIYIPPKYREKRFERTELPNAVILSTSGAAICERHEEIVTMETYLQSYKEIKDFAQNKIDQIEQVMVDESNPKASS